jgi:hypothetical protein
VTTATAAAHENEGKRGGGTGQEAGGPMHHAKKWRGSVPSDCGREERGSDERGDRTVGERQNGGQNGTDEEWDGGDRGRKRTGGGNVFGSERTPSSCLTTLCV